MKLTSKNSVLILAVFWFGLILSSCQIFQDDTGVFGSEAKDWQFIQSVGGIALGDPYEQNGMTFVPILLDVTGRQTITIQPVTSNPGLVCTEMRGTRYNNRLSLVIYVIEESKLPAGLGSSKSCDAIIFRRGGYGIWEFMTQYVYYEYNGRRELIGTVNLLESF